MQSDVNSPVTVDAPALSIILPFFRKLDEFRKVLPLNLPYFERPDREVILVLDENTEEGALLALLQQHPRVHWKVIVNDVPHAWRPPCKAINVGLRGAAGRHVLIASPESAFVGDVPAHMLELMRRFPDAIAIGRVAFTGFADILDGRTLEQHFEASIPPKLLLTTFYGSICGPRSAFESVRGYDEEFTGWGGDDDNLRVRLEMAGFKLLASPHIRLLHLSFESRTAGVNSHFAFDAEADRLKCSPTTALANAAADWGRDFTRISFANTVPHTVLDAAASLSDSPVCGPLPEARVVPYHSRRCCRSCGRLLFYEQLVAPCEACQSTPLQAASPVLAARPTTWKYGAPRIVCVLQLRNEAYYLEGCLAHLRDHVDGIIALDDGSTDGTAAILAREPKLIDIIVNTPQHEHVWRERENKQRLLERAREIGMDWVLCCDADERFETAFLTSLRKIANSFPIGDATCISVALKELWNSPHHYRVDGIWGRKFRARFFRLPETIGFEQDQDYHGQWYPDHLRRHGRMFRIDRNLYHLKTIHLADRLKRRDFYKQLDPERRFQPMGYDYLAEEGDELRLETIRSGREYDFGSLPGALQF